MTQTNQEPVTREMVLEEDRQALLEALRRGWRVGRAAYPPCHGNLVLDVFLRPKRLGGAVVAGCTCHSDLAALLLEEGDTGPALEYRGDPGVLPWLELRDSRLTPEERAQVDRTAGRLLREARDGSVRWAYGKGRLVVVATDDSGTSRVFDAEVERSCTVIHRVAGVEEGR